MALISQMQVRLYENPYATSKGYEIHGTHEILIILLHSRLPRIYTDFAD